MYRSSITMLEIIYTFLFLFLSIEAVSCSSELDDISQKHINVANIILNSMNKSVDPCNNFYEYACGNHDGNYLFDDINNDIRNVLLNIVEEDVKLDDIVPIKIEKQWFQLCMNLDKDGIKPLEDAMNQIGGWPMITGSEILNHQQTWQEVHKYYIVNHGYRILFDIFVDNDERNANNYIIKIEEPDLSLFEDLLKDNNVEYNLSKYETFMKKVATIFAGNKTSSDNILKDVKDVMEFENQLHMIKSTANNTQDNYNVQKYMKISELQEFYDQENQNNSKVNWLDVIRDTFKVINVTIEDSEEISLTDETFLQKLSNLLNNVSNRIIVNYIHWQFILSSIKYTNRELWDLLYELHSERPGMEQEAERRDECFYDLKIRHGLQYEFVTKYFPDEKRELGSEIFAVIRNKMIDRIQQSSWLDDLTKNKTINKIRKLNVFMGYLDILNNETYIEHIYDQFTFGSSYCETYLNYMKFEFKRNLQLLRKDAKDTNDLKVYDLRVTDLDETLGYVFEYQKMRKARAVRSNASENSSYQLITEKILSTPLFDSSIPPSVNIGNVGAIIGHEIGHAIDPKGRLYNENGNYENLWPAKTIEIYKNKSHCFIHQFNNYSLDGNLTLEENIADTIGLQIAYDTFKNISSNADIRHMQLPGLEELSDDQLFFVSFANSFCQRRSNNLEQLQSNDVHSPHNYRVIGSVSNLESFARAFNCPSNSAMNPITKCDLWS